MIALAWTLIVIGAAAVVFGAVRDELVWQYVASAASVASLVAVAVLAARSHRAGQATVRGGRAAPDAGTSRPPSTEESGG